MFKRSKKNMYDFVKHLLSLKHEGYYTFDNGKCIDENKTIHFTSTRTSFSDCIIKVTENFIFVYHKREVYIDPMSELFSDIDVNQLAYEVELEISERKIYNNSGIEKPY